MTFQFKVVADILDLLRLDHPDGIPFLLGTVRSSPDAGRKSQEPNWRDADGFGGSSVKDIGWPHTGDMTRSSSGNINLSGAFNDLRGDSEYSIPKPLFNHSERNTMVEKFEYDDRRQTGVEKRTQSGDGEFHSWQESSDGTKRFKSEENRIPPLHGNIERERRNDFNPFTMERESSRDHIHFHGNRVDEFCEERPRGERNHGDGPPFYEKIESTELGQMDRNSSRWSSDKDFSKKREGIFQDRVDGRLERVQEGMRSEPIILFPSVGANEHLAGREVRKLDSRGKIQVNSARNEHYIERGIDPRRNASPTSAMSEYTRLKDKEPRPVRDFRGFPNSDSSIRRAVLESTRQVSDHLVLEDRYSRGQQGREPGWRDRFSSGENQQYSGRQDGYSRPERQQPNKYPLSRYVGTDGSSAGAVHKDFNSSRFGKPYDTGGVSRSYEMPRLTKIRGRDFHEEIG